MELSRAYGFFRDDETKLSDLKSMLFNSGGSFMGLVVVPLDRDTDFKDSPAGFDKKVRRAINARMNYAVEAVLCDVTSIEAAYKLAFLFQRTLGSHDNGVVYWTDGSFHYLQEDHPKSR